MYFVSHWKLYRKLLPLLALAYALGSALGPDSAARAQQTFTLSGRVDDPAAGTGIPNVTMTLMNGSGLQVGTQSTDSNGNYSFAGLAAGFYEVTPSKSGFTFHPVTRGCNLGSGCIGTQIDFHGTPTSPSPTPTPTPTGTVQFDSVNYAASENDRSVPITVTRAGSTAAASVFYQTNNGSASDRSDYTAALGTLRFAPGEASKTFTIFITDDAYLEELETLTVTLSEASGVALGSSSAVTVTIASNDPTNGTNPVRAATFDPQFFVRQHYVDFFNREPDAGGLAFWAGQTTGCGSADLQVCRDNVSAAFFVSIEFQQTGYLVYKMYQAAYGPRPGESVPVTLREFMPDIQRVGSGVVVGQAGWEQQLEQNKTVYAEEFAARARFAALRGVTVAQFVATLNQNVEGQLTPDQVSSLEARLNSNQMTRAQALREVAENAAVTSRFYNRAFVLMQYYGYLRRNPYDPPELNLDFGGYNFWLGKLNSHGGNFITSEMVRSYITSGEYETRFGQ